MSSKQITGRAIIRVDGRELRTENGATLNPGGSNREAVVGGGQVQGFREEDVAPALSCQVRHTADLSIRELSDITSATVMFETDTGVQFILRGAFTTAPAELDSSSGNVALAMSAMSCDEV